MSKQKTAKKPQKSFEESLWDTATKLRGSVESSDWSGATEPERSGDSRRQTTRQGSPKGERGGAHQYSRAERDRLPKAARRADAEASVNHVVLSLIFLKFVSDKFEERRAELIADGKEKYTDMVEWSGATWTTRQGCPEGERGGAHQFYTMQNVFYLPETSRWSYIQQHAKQGDIAIKIDSALTAVEKSNASLKGALPDNYFSRLGLDGSKLSALIDAINNIFFKDQHPDLKADYIMANPPFNLKDWRAADTAMRDSANLETAGNSQVVSEAKDNLVHDGRWNGYDTPPTGNANYAWILHMVSKLSENGVAGFVLANGSMSTNTKGEGEIRQKMVENDLVDTALRDSGFSQCEAIPQVVSEAKDNMIALPAQHQDQAAPATAQTRHRGLPKGEQDQGRRFHQAVPGAGEQIQRTRRKGRAA